MLSSRCSVVSSSPSWLSSTALLKSCSSSSAKLEEGFELGRVDSSTRSIKAWRLTLLEVLLLTSIIGKHTRSEKMLIFFFFLMHSP